LAGGSYESEVTPVGGGGPSGSLADRGERARDDTRTVLVVDDEPQLVKLLSNAFRRAGYDVITAGDATSALGAFELRRDTVDAVFLDVRIPPAGIGSVLETLLAVRPGLAVVLTSGDELPDGLQERLASAHGLFVRKPFTISGALRALDGLLAAGARCVAGDVGAR